MLYTIWHMVDRIKHNLTNKAYYQRNKERLAAEKREQYKQDPSYVKQKASEYYFKLISTPEGRIKYREYRNKINYNNRMRTIEILGGKCVVCGFSDCRALQVDHINSDGKEERLGRGHTQSALHTAIGNSPEKFQLLCANCNIIKKHESGEIKGKKLKYD